MPFTGYFDHTLDDRGRVALPAKYRKDFERGAVLLLIAEGCIAVHTPDSFAKIADESALKPATTPDGRWSTRMHNAFAFDVDLDRQGRVLIPPALRQRAGLNGAVTIIGNYYCLEIWNPEDLDAGFERARMASSPERDQG
jgi:MraZ protein